MSSLRSRAGSVDRPAVQTGHFSEEIVSDSVEGLEELEASPIIRRSFLQRGGSFEVVAEERRRWAQSHPIGPVLPYAAQLFWQFAKQGHVWIWRMVCMFWYVLLLLPAFIKIGFYYMTSLDIVRNIQYGSRPRNFLDIYLPVTPLRSPRKRPVAVFLTGGIWIIGYKAWGAFFGRMLAAHGIITVTPDYRNYPQGVIDDMLADSAAAIEWVHQHIDEYGGDPESIHLMGQSAGAHLSAMVVLLKSLSEYRGSKVPIHEDSIHNAFNNLPHESAITWSVKHIRNVSLVAGPYDLVSMLPHFEERGLYRNVVAGIMGGLERLPQMSPAVLVREHQALFRAVTASVQCPPVYLFHGTSDTAVPFTSAVDFCSALVDAGFAASYKLYKGKSHTDPIIEDIVYVQDVTDEDVITDIVSLLKTSQWKPSALRKRHSFIIATDAEAAALHVPVTASRMSMIPWINVALARRVCPF